VSKLVFRDFDEFAEALPGIDGRFIPTARQTADWWIECTVVKGSCLHSGQIGGPATFAGCGRSGVISVALPITNAGQLRVDGQDFEPDAFILLQKEQFLTVSSQDVVQWAGVSLPVNAAIIEPALLIHSENGPRFQAPLPHLARLRSTICRVTENSGQIGTADPVTAAAIEQEIAVCLTHVLERISKERLDSRPQLSRGRVIARTLALIEASVGQPMFIDDLCRATQASERSLRNVFHEFFGVGPMRLLKVRQLNEIRAALLRADPQSDTVSRIAARFGVWDFSLFARNYKAMFGESPSRTLRTPPSDVRTRGPRPSWLYYASRIFSEDLAGTPRAANLSSAVPADLLIPREYL